MYSRARILGIPTMKMKMTPEEAQDILMSDELAYLLEMVKRLPPMTEEQRRNQAISFVYGNLQLSGIEVTKEQIGETYDRMHPAEEEDGSE